MRRIAALGMFVALVVIISYSRTARISYADLILDPRPWFGDKVSVRDTLIVSSITDLAGGRLEVVLRGNLCPDSSERAAENYTAEALESYCGRPYDVTLLLNERRLDGQLKTGEEVKISGELEKHDCQLLLEDVAVHMISTRLRPLATEGIIELNFGICAM